MVMPSASAHPATEPAEANGRSAVEGTATPPSTKDAPPLRSVHTSNFPELLRHLHCSILVTTFQAGRVILLRPAGNVLNTHFLGLPRPMGLAADENRIFVGAHRSVGPAVHDDDGAAEERGVGRQEVYEQPRDLFGATGP